MSWTLRRSYVDPVDVATSGDWSSELEEARRLLDELIGCDLGKHQAVVTLVARIHNIIKRHNEKTITTGAVRAST